MFDAFYPPKYADVAHAEEMRKLTQEMLTSLIEPKNFPDVLYHYTDMASFLGIIESGMLWATHLAYMNDFSEYLHGVDLGRTIVSDINKHEKNDEKKQFWSALENLLDRNAITINDYPPIFITCFTVHDSFTMIAVWVPGLGSVRWRGSESGQCLGVWRGD